MTGRWVIASANPGKIREIRALLRGSGNELVPQRELGVDDADETALTFVENALIKARHAARRTGLPAIADDSGLCVDALDGEPGVRSARYAGATAGDAENVAQLLHALSGVAEHDRGASFHCVLVALESAADPAPLIAHGCWRGTIALHPTGSAGFGYDPVFVDPESGLTAAELEPIRKNRVSHRGAAVSALAVLLRERGWLG